MSMSPASEEVKDTNPTHKSKMLPALAENSRTKVNM